MRPSSEGSSTEEAETASRRGHRFYVAFTDTFYVAFTDLSVSCGRARNLLPCSTFLPPKGVSNAEGSCSSRYGGACTAAHECRHSRVSADGDDLGLAAERRLRQERLSLGQRLKRQAGTECPPD